MKSAHAIVAPCVTAVSVILDFAGPSVAGVARRHVEPPRIVGRRAEAAGAVRRGAEVAAASGTAADCKAILDQAALRAVGRTGPLGQMQIYGDPVAFGPNLRRVEVHGFGSDYNVDLTIDGSCNVLSVTTDDRTIEPSN